MLYINALWFLIAAVAAALPIPFIKQYTLDENLMWIVFSVLSYLILINRHQTIGCLGLQLFFQYSYLSMHSTN